MIVLTAAAIALASIGPAAAHPEGDTVQSCVDYWGNRQLELKKVLACVPDTGRNFSDRGELEAAMWEWTGTNMTRCTRRACVIKWSHECTKAGFSRLDDRWMFGRDKTQTKEIDRPSKRLKREPCGGEKPCKRGSSSSPASPSRVLGSGLLDGGAGGLGTQGPAATGSPAQGGVMHQLQRGSGSGLR